MGGTCSNFLSCGDHGAIDPNEQGNNAQSQVHRQPEASVIEDGGDQVAALPQSEGAQGAQVPKRKQRALYISTEAERRQGLSTTPQGDQRSIYRFFCPICFCYYQEMFKTGCCGNYICEDCGLKHVLSKCTTDTSIVSLPKEQLDISCPHCALTGVRFVAVKGNEAIREYVESPGTKLALERARGLGVGKSLKEAMRTPGASSHSSCTRAVSHGDISMPYSKEPATDSGKYVLSSSHSDPGPHSSAPRDRSIRIGRRKEGSSASRPSSAEATPSPDTRARLLTPLTLARPLQPLSQPTVQLPGAVAESEPEPTVQIAGTAGLVAVAALSGAVIATSSAADAASAPAPAPVAVTVGSAATPSSARSPASTSESSTDSPASSSEGSASAYAGALAIAGAAEAPVLLPPAQTQQVVAV